MTDVELAFYRIGPHAGRYQLLPIRDRDGKVFRVEAGDAHAIVEPGDGRLRIPYVEAEGDTRMSDLLSRLVDETDCRNLRFVEPRISDGPLEQYWGHVATGEPLDEVLRDYEEVEEEWDASEYHDAQTVLCFDVEWGDGDE